MLDQRLRDIATEAAQSVDAEWEFLSVVSVEELAAKLLPFIILAHAVGDLSGQAFSDDLGKEIERDASDSDEYDDYVQNECSCCGDDISDDNRAMARGVCSDCWETLPDF